MAECFATALQHHELNGGTLLHTCTKTIKHRTQHLLSNHLSVSTCLQQLLLRIDGTCIALTPSLYHLLEKPFSAVVNFLTYHIQLEKVCYYRRQV